MTIVWHSLRRVIAGAVLLAPTAGWAELVYDNSREYSTNFVAHTFEYGDEIRLAGSARTVTSFQFELYGEFTPQSVVNVRLRFYANDVAGQFLAPGTLLYQSELLRVAQGFNALAVSGLSVPVPNSFTWTVAFSGLTMTAGDQAGLVLYGNPSVGSSLNDYWQKGGRGWQLYRFPGGIPVANFAARVYALPDPQVRFLSHTRLPSGIFQTLLSGPIGGRFEIEGSSDLNTWTPLTPITFPASTLDFLDSQARTSDRRFYRVSLPPLGP